MSNKENVIHQFGKNARKYVTSEGHAKGKDLDMLVEIAKESKKEKLLDIATGGGHVANAVAPIFEKVTALDLTPGMLKKAKEFIEGNGHTNVSFVQGDAESLPFPDKVFDTVSCRIAPHHFPNIDRFVIEVHRVLEANGLFILIDNIAPELDEYDQFYNFIEKKRDPSHYRAYKKSEWISLLERKGFRMEGLTSFKKRFLFEAWCEMMDLPEKDKTELNEFIISSSEDLVKFFSIDIKDNDVQSFQVEAMVIAVRKEEEQ
ncbi:methyltransferase domain-containing protein [Sporosarcina sp. ACRSM]|uniref:class I SAM-dependent methyltransferase n=1 Tax=Sporosarcina sp. ACRSM TaxID=2918216 RepID=UPI001EF6F9E9|nr:class I SAM-dependent methyltransferase [Sporosarcina sp. ACRSM]MCG7334734.1 methyltransferase domain-containing protein [Sporosarcina sp. ACRSM]